MNRGQRPRIANYSSARPAGESDESQSDDDDYFGAFSHSNYAKKTGPKSETVAVSKTNGTNGTEDWEDDWEEDADAHATSSSAQNGQRQVAEYWGETPSQIIRYACMRGNLDKLKEQLSVVDCNYDINKFYEDAEETPLITACMYGNLEIVEYLLTEKSANPNLKHPTPKTTPLLAVAACSVYKEEDVIVKIATQLVKAGANVDIQDRYGMTPLMLSVKHQRCKLAEYLLKQGADSNITDPDGQTALFFAVKDGDGRMCRRLIEHGADVSMEDRYGWSVAELAQDQNFPELSNLLFIVRDTKWKPGLHPELMKELDEEAAAERKLRSDKDLVREDSCIEMMLQAVDGEKYLGNFRKHKISYIQFLTLDDDQLKEIGVDEVGVREKVLDNIKRINNAQWQSSSIKNISTNKNVTAAEAVCMVVNMKDHLEHISASTVYLNKRIKQQPLALRYDVERNRIEDLMKFCEQAEARSRQVRQSILELHKTIGELQGYSELQIVGRIPKRSFNKQKKSTFQWKLCETIITGVGLVSVCMFIGLKFVKRSSL